MIDLTLLWSAMRWLMALLAMAAALWAINAARQRREARKAREGQIVVLPAHKPFLHSKENV